MVNGELRHVAGSPEQLDGVGRGPHRGIGLEVLAAAPALVEANGLRSPQVADAIATLPSDRAAFVTVHCRPGWCSNAGLSPGTPE